MNVIQKSDNIVDKTASFATPVLLIIFNRPDTTKRVFEVIRQQRPKFLFVAADGPRPGREDDIEKCRAAREIIKVEWDCEFHTLYRNENRGCGYGPAEAITWFFEQNNEGIILEDDILPGPGFFEFMRQMLSAFRNDSHVNMVSGLNLAQHWSQPMHKYIFTSVGGTAGWGTWKRVWKHFDYNMKAWKSGAGVLCLRDKIKNRRYLEYYISLFDKMSVQIGTDFWDYQWLYTRLVMGGYCIIPVANLVENIGFGQDATHTTLPNHPQANIRHGELKLPVILYPVKGNRLYDWYIFERFMSLDHRSFFKKIILKSIKYLFISK